MSTGLATQDTGSTCYRKIKQNDNIRARRERGSKTSPIGQIMNMDNEKDYESIPIPIAQQGKRQNPVQGEASKTDPERVTCQVCQKD